MPNLLDKNKCVGCTACVSICPQHCLEVLQDEFGFYYPKIKDSGKCVECHLCENVCPVKKTEANAYTIPKA